MINDKLYYNYLLDFYENLLTERQLEILELYFKKDYSMNEIAEVLKISKAAVSDLINRSIKQLNDYELKLKNYEKFSNRLELYEMLLELNDDRINNIVMKLKENE